MHASCMKGTCIHCIRYSTVSEIDITQSFTLQAVLSLLVNNSTILATSTKRNLFGNDMRRLVGFV